MKIKNEVANILANSIIERNNLFLPPGQLERKLYVDVNKVLVAIGGKWNRKVKAHIFEDSPEAIVEEILLTGEYTDAKKEFQFFETPETVANMLIDMADIQPGETILEPSAGKGAIAELICFSPLDFGVDPERRCDCVELNFRYRQYLKDNRFSVVGNNFLFFEKEYDVIIANPPFTKQQDIDHVLHMIKLARRKVVSVMSSSILFRENKKTVNFRKILEELSVNIIKLPEKAFAKSGTNVNTCIVSIDIKE